MKSTAQPDLDPQAPLPTGPTGLPKQRPALAQLREALTALHIGGLCRTVAYELLTYWSPGGDVFPSVKTLADDMGLKPRVVRHHIARLERVGLWVRIERKGKTNLYALHLPGEAQKGFVQPRPRHTRAAPPGTHVPLKWSLEVQRAPLGRSAACFKNGVVHTPEPGNPAPPLEAVAAPPSIDEVLKFAPPGGGEPGPHQQAFMAQLQKLRKGRRKYHRPVSQDQAPLPKGCSHERARGGFCETCGDDIRQFGETY